MRITGSLAPALAQDATVFAFLFLLSAFPSFVFLNSTLLTFFPAARHSVPVMANVATEFQGVTAITKANVYFDGKVVSHSILFPDKSKKTLGLIYPGKFHFGTGKSERMEIVAGECQTKLDGQSTVNDYVAGQFFDIPANSGFDIEVKLGICEYVCSFLA